MNRFGFTLTFKSKYRYLLMATIPVLYFNKILNSHTNKAKSNLWQMNQLRQSFGLRSARLVTNTSQVFNNELFKSFVSIGWHFEKTLNNDYEGSHRSICAGIIVTKTGLVVTAGNKIANYTTVCVKLSDGRQVLGRVVCRQSNQGLSAIQIMSNSDHSSDSWPTAKFNTNPDYSIGTVVYSLANHMENDGTFQVTDGLICGKPCLGRRLLQKNKLLNEMNQYVPTSVAIKSTNIGCPVIDQNGLILGITCHQHTRGLNFIIPYVYIQAFLDGNPYLKKMPIDLIKSYGLITKWMDPTNRHQFEAWLKRQGKSLPKATHGLVVMGFERGNNSRLENIQLFDVITQISGQKLTKLDDVYEILSAQKDPDNKAPALGIAQGMFTIGRNEYKYDVNWAFV